MSNVKEKIADSQCSSGSKPIPSFFEFLAEEAEKENKKCGRPRGSFKWDPEDAKFIDDVWSRSRSDTKMDMNAKIKAARKLLLKKIQRVGANPTSTKLSDLYKQAEDLGIQNISARINHNPKPPKRHPQSGELKNWQKFEKDVAAGIQNLLASGFYKIVSREDRDPVLLVDNPTFKAEIAGGALNSDIRVSHNHKKFYVECKLNYEDSSYFKYNLELENGKFHYDHKKYLQGKVGAERKQIDRLFKYKLNLDQMLDEILGVDELEHSARIFFRNLEHLAQVLKKSDEFKLFTKHIQLGRKYPEGFQQFADVFDEYLKHYATRYNQIVQRMFSCLVDEMQVKELAAGFKVGIQDGDGAELVQDLALEISDLEDELAVDLFKSQAAREHFNDLADLLAEIERKFEAISFALKLPRRAYNALFKLEKAKKLMYFFKAFLSGAKWGTSMPDVNELGISPEEAAGEVEADKLGIMEICKKTQFENYSIAKKIADFYVLKDNCAYIQIADTIFMLDPDYDPLNLQFAPLFVDSMNQFEAKISVSDDLSEIRLHLRCVQPQNLVGDQMSFVQSDSNYVAKMFKDGIEINIS